VARVQPVDARGERAGAQAGRVHQLPRADAHRLGAAHVDVEAAGHHRHVLHRAVEGEHRAARLGVALQRQHQAVAVDDAGGRRVQRRHAAQRGLHRARRGAVQQHRVVHAVGQGLRVQRLQRGQLRRLPPPRPACRSAGARCRARRSRRTAACRPCTHSRAFSEPGG
jgi:hypothetical protein